MPWDILAHDCGQDINAAQVASPRIFKSHEPYATIAKGGRYIYVMRNPEDAFVSFHKFLPAYMGVVGKIDFETFAGAIFGGLSQSGGIWDHYVGWWARRNDPDVLLVCFEDLIDDLAGQIARIADFLSEIPTSLEGLEQVRAHSTYDYMSEHVSKFDDHFVFSHIRKQIGLDGQPFQGVAKVRKGGGKVGGRKALPPAVYRMLEDRWSSTVEASTGLKSYDEMRKFVRLGK